MDDYSLDKEFEFSVVLDGIIFYIYDSGRVDFRSKPLRCPLHRHFTYELRYVHEGVEQLVTEKEYVFLEKTDLCFLSRNLYHCALSDNVSRTCFNVEIGLEEGSESTEKLLRIKECLKAAGDYRVFRDEHISRLMEESYQMLLSDAPHSETYRGMLFVSVFLRLVDILAEEEDIRFSAFGRLKRTRAFERKRVIEHHLAQNYNVEGGLAMLSQKLFLSEKQTGMLVKKLMGASYKRLITVKRMTMANRLMRQKRLSLMDIARHVGYSSYNGFFSAYQKAFGISPEEVKKRIAAHDVEYEKQLEQQLLASLKNKDD